MTIFVIPYLLTLIHCCSNLLTILDIGGNLPIFAQWVCGWVRSGGVVAELLRIAENIS